MSEPVGDFLRDLLPYLLQRTSHLVTRRFHEALRLKNVSVSRWRMLAWLAEHQPATINELTEHLMLRQPTVTQLVNDAVRAGIVTKSSDGQDKRRQNVSLTPSGVRLAEDLKREAAAAEAHTMASFGADGLDELKRRLRQVIDHFETPGR